MDSQTSTSKHLDLYQIVTDKVIELLEQGVVPWQRPWKENGMPINMLSKRPYRGINLWLLNALPYESNCFFTWDQIKALGGSVLKDEKGHIIVFWKNVKKKPEEKNADGSFATAPMLRYYKVFNLEQCKDIPVSIVPVQEAWKSPDPIMECESILNNIADMPLISFKGKAAAYYNVETDEITMPKMKDFKTSHSYYATLWHELVHATGATKRLDRKTLVDRTSFGSESYAQEELIAEMGAAFLCQFTSILPFEIANHAAYIQGWLDVLKNDKKCIITAAGGAQKAVDWILGRMEAEPKEEVNESSD